MTPKVAVVTGATRGVGRGVVLAMHQAGYRVFTTGRSIEYAQLPGGVVRIECDHLWDKETDRAFELILRETQSMDVLAGCAWGGYEQMTEDGDFTWANPFWKQSANRWIGMIGRGR